MEAEGKTQVRIEDVDDNAKVTVTAKDLKIVLSVLSAGASRGLFKPEEFSLLGELNDNIRKSLVDKK
jgi:hypothetical protein